MEKLFARISKSTWLQTPYNGLLVISILLSFLYAFVAISMPDNQTFFSLLNREILNQGILPNWGSRGTLLVWLGRGAVGVFASYLTVVIVDGTFEQQRQQEQERVQQVAFSELKGAISDQLRMIEEWYKAAVDEVPEEKPETYDELLESDDFEEIRMLDFASQCPRLNATEDYTWRRNANDVLTRSNESIETVLKKYGHKMEPEMVEALSDLNTTTFHRNITSPTWLKFHPNGPHPHLLVDAHYRQLLDHIDTMKRVCDAFNNYSLLEDELNKLGREITTFSNGCGRYEEYETLEDAVENHP